MTQGAILKVEKKDARVEDGHVALNHKVSEVLGTLCSKYKTISLLSLQAEDNVIIRTACRHIGNASKMNQRRKIYIFCLNLT